MNKSSSTSFNFIGKDSTFNGDLILSGDTHVFGKINGKISGPPEVKLIVEYTGQIEGDVSGVSIVIHGQLLGDIKHAERVEVTSTGKVKGCIESNTFEIFPGAKIVGEIKSRKKESHS